MCVKFWEFENVCKQLKTNCWPNTPVVDTVLNLLPNHYNYDAVLWNLISLQFELQRNIQFINFTVFSNRQADLPLLSSVPNSPLSSEKTFCQGHNTELFQQPTGLSVTETTLSPELGHVGKEYRGRLLYSLRSYGSIHACPVFTQIVLLTPDDEVTEQFHCC